MEKLSIKESIYKLNKKILIAGIILSGCIWLICLIGLLFGLGGDEKGDIIGFLIIWPFIYFIVILVTAFVNQISESEPFNSIFGNSKIINIIIQLLPLCALPCLLLKEIGANIISKL